MTQAVRNTQDGISLLRTADGGLGETVAILQRMRDLSVQAASSAPWTRPRRPPSGRRSTS